MILTAADSLQEVRAGYSQMLYADYSNLANCDHGMSDLIESSWASPIIDSL